MRCSVQNCINNDKRMTKRNGITFHVFPREHSLRSMWIEALGIHDWEPNKRSVICSKHFKQDAFYVTKSGLRKIKNGAVPMLGIQSPEDMEIPAALRACRMCLAIDVKMYHITDYNLNNLYEEFTGIMLNPEDRLLKMVCWECVGRLMSAKRFKDKAHRCHNLLEEKFNTKNCITLRDLKSINRFQHKLQSSLIVKYFEDENCDLLICDNESIKTDKGEECDDNLSEDNNDNTDDMVPVVSLQDMDENIFMEKHPGFESEDTNSLSLSESYKEKNEKYELKKDKAKKVRVRIRFTDADTPSTTMEKYKNTSVRRRKTNDLVDENPFTITKLTYDEQIAEVQARQASAEYAAAPHKCTVCYRSFQLRWRYDAHMLRHSEKWGAYECFICKMRMKTAVALRKHLTTMHTEEYSCRACSFVTRDRNRAREHNKWHAGTKYQCLHCPRQFEKVTSYMNHMRIKHVSSYVCELCGYTFVSQKGIDLHKNLRHLLEDKDLPLEGPYCAECDVRFMSEEAYARHLKLSSRHSSDDDPNRIRNVSKNIHTEPKGQVGQRTERRLISCEQCGIQLQSGHVYAHHFRRVHPDQCRTKYPGVKSPFMCEQCGRIFQCKRVLNTHMFVHSGEKRVEKRFKCDHCGRSFKQKANLIMHMGVHSASRPSYECPVCGKHFAFSKNIRRHMFVHMGLRPFKCEICGKCFTTRSEQRSHVEHVHLKKPWPKRTRVRAPQGSPEARLIKKYEKTGRV